MFFQSISMCFTQKPALCASSCSGSELGPRQRPLPNASTCSPATTCVTPTASTSKNAMVGLFGLTYKYKYNNEGMLVPQTLEIVTFCIRWRSMRCWHASVLQLCADVAVDSAVGAGHGRGCGDAVEAVDRLRNRLHVVQHRRTELQSFRTVVCAQMRP